MAINRKKLWDQLSKYKYPLLVLLIGIGLMLIPGRKQDAPTPEISQQTQPAQPDAAAQLEAVLVQIQGVGKVKVLLTQAAGESYLYQTDEDSNMSDSGSSNRKDTVIVTDADRNQNPILTQVLPPKYLGAVIVCQGAEDPGVKLAIVEAVSKATGLGTDKISVLKMK